MTASSNASTAINDAENRIVGMMVGSAVSDAIGIYGDGLTEAECRTAYPRRRILASYKANELTPHYPDDHRAKYEDGNWSEATEMALCSLFSHVHDTNTNQLPNRLRQLSRDGNRAYGLLPLDLGRPTKAIVESAGYISDPKAAALKWWVDNGRGVNDRNGSNAPLVRIHPVAAIATEYNLNWAVSKALDNCRVTHVDSRCNISTMIAIALLRGLIRREVRTEQQINPIIQRCKRQLDYFVKNIPDAGQNKEAYYTVSSSDELSRLLTAESMDDLQLDRSEDRGDVWKCLGAGIFCLRYAMARLERVSGQEREDFRRSLFADTINNLVLRGGAAQANAAFAGALLGAYLGYYLVPEKWRKGLSHKGFLMRKCKLLCTSVGVIPGNKDRRERDSRLFPGRNASERRAMQGTIQNRRRTRKQMLQRRWNDTANRAESRRTGYNSLKFPPLGN